MVRSYVATALAIALTTGAVRLSKVSQDVYDALEEAKYADILVEHGGIAPGLSEAQGNIRRQHNCIKSREIKNSLESYAKRKQECVTNVLAKNGIKCQSYWISNVVHVKDASKQLVHAIEKCDSVTSIILEPLIPIQVEDTRALLGTIRLATSPTWGVQKIGAPSVWANGNEGEGVVVGTIDTGVLHTHDALIGKWRSDHGWFDPVGRSATPYDASGHGTHIMGVLVGSFGIGVAPKASFITCLGCPNGVCPGSAIIACAQFLLCPTTPSGTDENCTLHPHVINNSWGGRGNYSWFDGSIAAWRMAGMIPIFPIGNSGSSCATSSSPGDSKLVIGVGATGNGGYTTGTDALAYFSSRGGGHSDGRIKPDISAPGYFVLSSVSSTNSSYGYWAGTSMASPHVAGAVALLLAQNISMTYDRVYQLLTSSADTSTLISNQQNCGRVFDSTYPNNNYGYGRLNIARATASLNFMGMQDLPPQLPDF